MPSLLDDPYADPGQSSRGLLGLDMPQIQQPNPDTDQGAALGQTYQAIMAEMERQAQASAEGLARERQRSIDMGLWTGGEPWEGGHPTGAGLLDIGKQYGNALLMGTTAPGAVAPTGPRLNPDAVGFADRISTRQPSRATDAHDTADYTVGLPAFDDATGPYQGRAAEAIARHPGVTDTSPEGFISHLSGNIRSLYDAVPDAWKGQAMNWYRGARGLAEQMADQFGTSVRAQAGNLAAQSPQRAWDHNVEGSMRTADIVANHSNTPWNADHARMWDGYTGADGNPVPGFGETNPNWAPLYSDVQGKTLGEITDPTAAALWVRLHDRAYAPHQNVPVVRPNGTRGDFLRSDDGTPDGLQWGSLKAIGNSISSLRDDSLPNISANMGDAHKVRNFYNNIVSPDAGHDVTIDTHAISAALLRPLGSSAPEVSYGLGSPVKKDPYRLGADPWPTTMNNDPQGLKGIYPLYAEAYRRVADDLGIMPRELQSATWEGIKGLYNDVDRRNAPLIRENTDMWKAVSNGTRSADDVRAQILGRGIRDPAWFSQ